jgi:catalase (peroxidase I)
MLLLPVSYRVTWGWFRTWVAYEKRHEEVDILCDATELGLILENPFDLGQRRDLLQQACQLTEDVMNPRHGNETSED